MHFNRFVFMLLITTVLSSCNSGTQESTAHKNSVKSSNSLAGHVYYFAPAIDSINCEIIAECDCCADDFLFINDTQFLRIANCMVAKTVITGIYSFEDDNVILLYDSIAFSTETDKNNELKTISKDSMNYLITKESIGFFRDTLKPYKCNNANVYQTKDGKSYGAISLQDSINIHINELRNQGFFKKLSISFQ